MEAAIRQSPQIRLAAIQLRDQLPELEQRINDGLPYTAKHDDGTVVRDPARNEIIVVPREGNAFFYHTGGMIGAAVDDPLAMIRRTTTRA